MIDIIEITRTANEIGPNSGTVAPDDTLFAIGVSFLFMGTKNVMIAVTKSST